ncbi:MAG: hypothetical protein JNL80_14765 [Phycisphaerae bacterium]|jgi:hypothetical protein|nr:hypothetical protein [Phycisphaerae bacterium]
MTTAQQRLMSPQTAGEILARPVTGRSPSVGSAPGVDARRMDVVAEVTWRCLHRAVEPGVAARAPMSTADVPLTLSLHLRIERSRGRGRLTLQAGCLDSAGVADERRSVIELPVSGRCTLSGRWLVMELGARSLLRTDSASKRIDVGATVVFDLGECPHPIDEAERTWNHARLAYIHSNVFPELGIPGGRYGPPLGTLRRFA